MNPGGGQAPALLPQVGPDGRAAQPADAPASPDQLKPGRVSSEEGLGHQTDQGEVAPYQSRSGKTRSCPRHVGELSDLGSGLECRTWLHTGLETQGSVRRAGSGERWTVPACSREPPFAGAVRTGLSGHSGPASAIGASQGNASLHSDGTFLVERLHGEVNV